MGVPWPSADPVAWGTVGIGTSTTPGIATVSVNRSNEVEVKKPKGSAGASTTGQGPNPADVEIELLMLNQAELDAWFALADILVPAKESSTPLAIRHPKTAGYRIDAITVKDVSDAPNKVGDQYTVKIKCVEWRPAPKGKKVTKTEKKLEPRNNSLGRGNTERYIAVERPSRDSRNTRPR